MYLEDVTADSRSPAAPIAIRITRPYASEDEYLEHELDTLTRASITLVGAQPRAEGVVLRFEVALPSGQVLVRGEGRVVGFKANAHQGLGGLALRFTRLDMRSKALVDRAAALRERRRPSSRPASVPPPAPRVSVPLRPSATPPPLPVQSLAAPLPTPSSAPPSRSAAPPPLRPSIHPQRSSSPPGLSASRPPPPYVFRAAPTPLATAEAPVRRSSRPPPPPNDAPPGDTNDATAALAPPPVPAFASPAPAATFTILRAADRDSALQRLRARVRALDPAVVARIVGARDA